MRITATEEYGLRCLVLLAKKGPSVPLTLADIGGGEGLSQPYAAKIMNLLRQAGLVESVRGRNGGYILARSPETIHLAEAFEALGEPLFGATHCDKYGSPASEVNCVHQGDCSVRDVWKGMHHLISSLLDQVTLQDVVRASDGAGMSIVDLAKQQLAKAQIGWQVSPGTVRNFKR